MISEVALLGDANVVDGWSNRNIVAPFPIPYEWARLRSFDWGYAAPFSVGWWAQVSDDYRPQPDLVLPRGCLVRYREWYGCEPPRVRRLVGLDEAAISQ